MISEVRIETKDNDYMVDITPEDHTNEAVQLLIRKTFGEEIFYNLPLAKREKVIENIKKFLLDYDDFEQNLLEYYEDEAEADFIEHYEDENAGWF